MSEKKDVKKILIDLGVLNEDEAEKLVTAEQLDAVLKQINIDIKQVTEETRKRVKKLEEI